MSRFTKNRAKSRKEKAKRIKSIDKGFQNIIDGLKDFKEKIENNPEGIKRGLSLLEIK